jgi:ribose/xylose/arabinose/galactoside ABC-type transport system permease subunit
VVLVLTKGYPVKVANASFLAIGQGELFGFPVQFILLILLAGVYAALLLTTPLGRYVYSIGKNPVATRLSGVRVPAVLAFVYIQASMMFGLGGLIYAARLGQGMPGIGKGLELPVIAAAVIGGTSMSGGTGTVWGTIIGASLISLILNALNMLKVSYFWQELVTGMVIILAVLFDLLNRRRTGGR